jgi:hypothetical protein
MKHTSPVCAYTYCTSVHTRHASGRGDGSRLNNIHDPSSTRNKAYSTTAPPFSLYKPPSSFDGRLPTFRQIPALSGFQRSTKRGALPSSTFRIRGGEGEGGREIDTRAAQISHMHRSKQNIHTSSGRRAAQKKQGNEHVYKTLQRERLGV